MKAEVTRQWMSREKELGKAALSWEKELEKVTLSREIETLALKELEKAVLSRANDTLARTETLRTKGLLTSRGVFEFVPKRIHFERRLGKKFFAQSTCDSLDEEPPSERTEAWKLKECFEHMRKHHPDATMAKMSIGKAIGGIWRLVPRNSWLPLEWAIGEYCIS